MTQVRGDTSRSGTPVQPGRPLVRQDGRRRIGTAVLAVAAVVGLFLLLYAVSEHAGPGNSDSATVVLEGQAMAHGNVLLHGWSMSLDSFWTIDALWYLLASLLWGAQPILIHAVPAAIATAVIVIGVVMAVDERRGAAAVAGAATVLVILGLPTHALAVFFLLGPLHVGTVLWCLVAFWALRRGGFGWGFAVGVAFLSAGLLGDLQTLALGVIPVLLAGLTAMARRRDWRAGLPQVAASCASVVIAELIREIAKAIGTFSTAHANERASVEQMVHNLTRALHEGVAMMGVGGAYYGLGADPKGLSYVHVLAIVVGLTAFVSTGAALVWGAARGLPCVVGKSSEASWRLDDMLFFATLASPATFVLLAQTDNPQFARYLTAGIIFGAILSGRVVGRVAQSFKWHVLGRLLGALGLAAACCYAAGVAINLDRPVPVSPGVGLASWFESHNLHDGIGSYWTASIVTLESRGHVKVRPVFSLDYRRLVRYNRVSSSAWYAEPFHFLVFDLAAPWGHVSWNTAVDTFGPPSKTYVVDGRYRVMVWNKAIHVKKVIPPDESVPPPGVGTAAQP